LSTRQPLYSYRVTEGILVQPASPSSDPGKPCKWVFYGHDVGFRLHTDANLLKA